MKGLSFSRAADAAPGPQRSDPPIAAQAGPPTARRVGLRLVVALAAALCLIAGLVAAVVLLGLALPAWPPRLADSHGPLLVAGFLGTLICLERAVALRGRIPLAAPVLLGVGSLLAIGFPVARWVAAGGAAGLLLIYLPLWRRSRDDAVLVESCGAAALLIALLAWAGGAPVPNVVCLFAAFLVLTIGGERLELARIALPATSASRLVLAALPVLIAASAAVLWPRIGAVGFGISLLPLVLPLVAHDIAWRTIKSAGLTAFMGGCMLAGYGWLLLAAGLWACGVAGPGSGGYDATLHATFLGFAMSMVFAHAPVIVPAVFGRRIPWSPWLVVPAVLLHGSLLTRVWLGDALGSLPARQISGVLNEAAIALFAIVVLTLLRRPKQAMKPETSDEAE